jgi:hypothetical protein
VAVTLTVGLSPGCIVLSDVVVAPAKLPFSAKYAVMAVFPSWTFDSATASAALSGVETASFVTSLAAPQPVRSTAQPARTKSFLITAGSRLADRGGRHSEEGTPIENHSNECRNTDRSVRRVVEHHVGVAAAGSPERGTPMTATAFDVPNTRHGDVAMALLSAIDVRDLERREAELTAREAEVLRREKSIDAVERIHELRGRNGSEVAVAAMVEDDSTHREEQRARRSGMKDALRIRERDWWIKILGIPTQA